MSAQYSVYVGPYLILPNGFDWTPWENVVAPGRGEADYEDENLILIPSQKLRDVDRTMAFDRYGDSDNVVQINPAMLVREAARFQELAADLWKFCDDRDIEIHEAWGVVPCWS